jgi:hypothetical protein
VPAIGSESSMGKVIDFSDERFSRLNAGKIVKACNRLDEEVVRLIWEDKIPPNELLAALCQRIGVYLSCTDANKEEIVKRLAKIIYKHSTTA